MMMRLVGRWEGAKGRDLQVIILFFLSYSFVMQGKEEDGAGMIVVLVEYSHFLKLIILYLFCYFLLTCAEHHQAERR